MKVAFLLPQQSLGEAVRCYEPSCEIGFYQHFEKNKATLSVIEKDTRKKTKQYKLEGRGNAPDAVFRDLFFLDKAT